jgi:hypothetical protein
MAKSTNTTDVKLDGIGAWARGWLRVVRRGLKAAPHYRVGTEDDPYLLRWYVLPRNRFLNLYLHCFLRDDDDRALHDHQWWFISVMLKGGYAEHTEDGIRRRRAPSIAFRRATHRHRVDLPRPFASTLFPSLVPPKPIPCWTLLLTGRRTRTWGFWCPQGFKPWHEFLSPDDSGRTGRGCE